MLLRAVLFFAGSCILFLIVGPFTEGRPLKFVNHDLESYVMTQCLPERFLQQRIKDGFTQPDPNDLDLLRSVDANTRRLTLKYFVKNMNARKSSRCRSSLVEYLLDRKYFVKELATAATSYRTSNVQFHFSCLECEAAAEIFIEVAKHGTPTESFFLKTLKFVCRLFEIEDDYVCKTVIDEFKDEFFYTARHVTMSVSKVCGILFPECSTIKDPLKDWNVTLPKTPKPPVVMPTLPPASAPKLRILQLSDIHMDFNYTVGAVIECDEPLCCTKGDSPAPSPSKGAGHWGSGTKCDVPYWTLENLFTHLNQSAKFDIIYWTGDLPSHRIWDQTEKEQIYIYKNLTKLFLKYFPKTPVYSSLGNHESAPVNSFPPPYVHGNRSISWLYDELIDSWGHWVPKNDMGPNMKKGAYYTTQIRPGLRLISLNMNYCNSQNWWMLINTTDPTDELKFLIKTLQYAEDHKEKVHIIGHIPPGDSSSCLKTWSFNYYRIINRYESTIAAQFFGHTHRDEFEIFFDEKNTSRPTNMAFVSPSVTTYGVGNSAYRIYEVDGDHKNTTHLVLDHETYILNVTEANQSGKPKWKLAYRAKDAYGMKNLLPTEWNNLVTRMKADDTLFQKFYRFYTKLSSTSPCTGDCKTDMLCKLRSARANDKTFCVGL